MKKVLTILTALSIGLLAGCGSTAASTAASSMAASSTADTASSVATGELSDWDYIADKGTLVIGMTIFDPMNYYDENGKLVGFDTELAEAVCEKLGVTPEFVEIDWDNKVIELNAKNIDCIWNGMTILDDLKSQIDFSMPYSENYQACIINQANAELYTDVASMEGCNIGAEAGSAGEAAIQADSVLSTCNYTSLAAQRNALIELKSGTLDVAVIDAVMAKASVGEGTDYTDLMVVPDVELSKEEYGIGLRQGSTVTADKINGAIQELANEGFLDELQQKYPSVMVTVSAQ